MTFQNSAVDEEIVYQNKVTITINMENGQPVANPEVVYLNNGGEIDWVMANRNQSLESWGLRPQNPRIHGRLESCCIASFGGAPFVVLLDTCTCGTPGGGKEINVLVKSLKKMEGNEDLFTYPFLQLVIQM